MHPDLDSLVVMAKDIGYTVALTTNGSLLNVKRLAQLRKCVDWIGLSVDSSSDAVEYKLGRGNGRHVTNSIQMADRIHEAGIHLKINSTITQLNYAENLHAILRTLNPERWKIFQYLPIHGQNNESQNTLAISSNQFRIFIQRHQNIILTNGESPVFEFCEDMIGSYFMLNPSGNILVNNNGEYSEIPFETAIKLGIDTIINPDKYLERKALYEWKHEESLDNNPGGRS